MAKDLNIAILLDFYGDLLTQKQKELMEYYYNDDLSLSEIAENENITRQGVHDSIRRGEHLLKEIESKLFLVKKFKTLSANVGEIKLSANRIMQENQEFCYSVTINNNSLKIINLCKNIDF